MKKLFYGLMMFFVVVGSVFAGQCDDDPSYNYSYGHRSIYLNDAYFDSVASNVRVCINSNVPSLWSNAVYQAISKLNYNLSSVDTILRYSYSTSICDITVKYDSNFSNNYIAEAKNILTPSSYIHINSKNSPSSFTDVKMKFTMMHELLHSIGLMYTGRNLYYQIPNTNGYWETKYMPTSIMCAVNSSSYPSLEFNPFDKLAIETLYPI